MVNALVFRNIVPTGILGVLRFTACALREHCHHAQCPDRSADLCFDDDVSLGADHQISLINGARAVAAGLLVMFILAYDADSEEFSKIGNYWVYAIVVYWSLGCVLLVRTYLNYRSDEDNTLRNAFAAGQDDNVAMA